MVVEIGPGPRRADVAPACAKAGRVIAIEIDPVLVQYLRAEFRDEPRLTLRRGRRSEGRLDAMGTASAVVGNLPYYITSPILEKTLALGEQLTRAVFLVQKEVAERLIARPEHARLRSSERADATAERAGAAFHRARRGISSAAQSGFGGGALDPETAEFPALDRRRVPRLRRPVLPPQAQNNSQQFVGNLRSRSARLDSRNRPSAPSSFPSRSSLELFERVVAWRRSCILKFHAACPFRPVAHRLSAHRQRQDVHFQLAVCPPQPRHDGSAHRRHRRRSQHPGFARFDFRRAEMAGSGLGRAISPVRARRSASPDGLGDFRKRPGVSRFHARGHGRRRKSTHGAIARGCSIPGCASFQPRKASAAPMRASRSCCGFACLARARSRSSFTTPCTAQQSKLAADIEDFALLRSNGVPTYHMASCADDVDLRISHIIRGQDHLTNTFKHVLIFEALGAQPPQFAHLPLLIAPGRLEALEAQARAGGERDHLSRRRIPAAGATSISCACWAGRPKTIARQMTRQELMDAFSFEGINRHNAVVNFTDEDPIRSQGDVAECRARSAPCRWKSCRGELLPFACAAGLRADPAKMLRSRRR